MATKQSNSVPETRLVRQAQKGDAGAFGQIYDTYIDRVFRFVHFRVNETQLAEDLTADTFLKAWDNLGKYEERGLPFAAWLFRIARNTVIDHYRTQKEELPLEAAATQTSETDPNEQVHRGLTGEEIRRAMSKLTQAQQDVLILKFIAGFSTKTVAGILNKKPGAIRALQMRGLQALDEIMESEDG